MAGFSKTASPNTMATCVPVSTLDCDGDPSLLNKSVKLYDKGLNSVLHTVHNKRPKHVVFIEEIPKTPVGKLLHRKKKAWTPMCSLA